MQSEQTFTVGLQGAEQTTRKPMDSRGDNGANGHASILSEYSFSPLKGKQHHHLVIHSGLSINHDRQDEDARTEEVALGKHSSGRFDSNPKVPPPQQHQHSLEQDQLLLTSRRLTTQERNPNELVTLDSMIVKMSDNDKRLLSEMLKKLEDQRIMLSQRNNVIEALSQNFNILRSMCQKQKVEITKAAEKAATLNVENENKDKNYHLLELKCRALESEKAKYKETQLLYQTLLDEHHLLRTRATALETTLDNPFTCFLQYRIEYRKNKEQADAEARNKTLITEVTKMKTEVTQLRAFSMDKAQGTMSIEERYLQTQSDNTTLLAQIREQKEKLRLLEESVEKHLETISLQEFRLKELRNNLELQEIITAKKDKELKELQNKINSQKEQVAYRYKHSLNDQQIIYIIVENNYSKNSIQRRIDKLVNSNLLMLQIQEELYTTLILHASIKLNLMLIDSEVVLNQFIFDNIPFQSYREDVEIIDVVPLISTPATLCLRCGNYLYLNQSLISATPQIFPWSF